VSEKRQSGAFFLDLAGFTYQQDNARPHRARTLVAHFVHQTTRFESHRHLEETERSQKKNTKSVIILKTTIGKYFAWYMLNASGVIRV
jgi:hypothetical protein